MTPRQELPVKHHTPVLQVTWNQSEVCVPVTAQQLEREKKDKTPGTSYVHISSVWHDFLSAYLKNYDTSINQGCAFPQLEPDFFRETALFSLWRFFPPISSRPRTKVRRHFEAETNKHHPRQPMYCMKPKCWDSFRSSGFPFCEFYPRSIIAVAHDLSTPSMFTWRPTRLPALPETKSHFFNYFLLIFLCPCWLKKRIFWGPENMVNATNTYTTFNSTDTE